MHPEVDRNFFSSPSFTSSTSDAAPGDFSAAQQRASSQHAVAVAEDLTGVPRPPEINPFVIPDGIEGAQQRAQYAIHHNPEFLSLRIAPQRSMILRKIRRNPVVFAEAATGQGKSTGLPPMLVAAGYDVALCVPRRAQAILIGSRIARLLGEDGPGETVGVYTRFEKAWSSASRIHVMTDGYLEVHSLVGKTFKRPNVPLALILDEVHVGTLHQTVVQGLWKRLLDKHSGSPQYRLVISSATINPDECFEIFPNAKHFKLEGPPHPITEIPLTGDVVQTIENAVTGKGWNTGVRCPGKREIEELQDELEGKLEEVDILPFHADLSPAELMRVYEPRTRKYVVLTTDNDGLTFPGLDYMIDLGLRRTQRSDGVISSLVTEEATQAEILQSKGRVGREKPGYFTSLTKRPFAMLRRFPETELHRISLDEAVLRVATLTERPEVSLKSLPLPRGFESWKIDEATARLQDLGFLDEDEQPTELAYSVANVPTSPNIARMLLAAEHEGILPEAVALAASMQAHGVFSRQHSVWENYCGDDCESDMLGALRLFQHGLKACRDLPREQHAEVLGAAGIKVRRFNRARENFYDLVDRLERRRRPVPEGERAPRTLRGASQLEGFEERPLPESLSPKLARCFIAGFPEGVFYRERDGYVGLAEERRRYLSAFSFVPDDPESHYVCGIPWTFDPGGDGDSPDARHVILWAAKISRGSVPRDLLEQERASIDRARIKDRNTKRRGHPGSFGGHGRR